MQIDKKSGIVLTVVFLLVIAAVIYFVSTKNPSTPETELEPGEVSTEIDTTVVDEEANVRFALESNESLKEVTIEVPGASPINKDNTVMTYEGLVADNTVDPGSALAPKVSRSLSKDEIPQEAINLDVSSAGFSLTEVSTSAGAPTTISLTSTDDQVHVLMFDDPSLKAIVLGVMPGETKAITFNAPGPGTYSFRCDVPGHKDRGEVGELIVR